MAVRTFRITRKGKAMTHSSLRVRKNTQKKDDQDTDKEGKGFSVPSSITESVIGFLKVRW